VERQLHPQITMYVTDAQEKQRVMRALRRIALEYDLRSPSALLRAIAAGDLIVVAAPTAKGKTDGQ